MPTDARTDLLAAFRQIEAATGRPCPDIRVTSYRQYVEAIALQPVLALHLGHPVRVGWVIPGRRPRQRR